MNDINKTFETIVESIREKVKNGDSYIEYVEFYSPADHKPNSETGGYDLSQPETTITIRLKNRTKV